MLCTPCPSGSCHPQFFQWFAYCPHVEHHPAPHLCVLHSLLLYYPSRTLATLPQSINSLQTISVRLDNFSASSYQIQHSYISFKIYQRLLPTELKELLHLSVTLPLLYRILRSRFFSGLLFQLLELTAKQHFLLLIWIGHSVDSGHGTKTLAMVMEGIYQGFVSGT